MLKKILTPVLFALATTASWANTDWKTFDNADKTKTFVGRLVGFDKKTDIVTVQSKSTMRPVRFKVELLSEEHRDYVKSRSIELQAAGSLRMMFYETVEQTGSERDKESSTKTYNGGYRIELRNAATEMIENVEIDYVLVYRKDAIKGNGEVLTMTGSANVTTLLPNIDENIVADGIPLSSYYKKSKASGGGAAGGST